MPSVLLNTGEEVLIDYQDIWVLSRLWHSKLKDNGKVYACHNELGYLHRAILGVSDPNILVDHRDGNTLDCRRGNLREVSRTTNRRNSPKHRGVFYYSYYGKKPRWEAYITVNKKRKHLGYFDTEEEAIAARLRAERELWGVEPSREHLHG